MLAARAVASSSASSRSASSASCSRPTSPTRRDVLLAGAAAPAGGGVRRRGRPAADGEGGAQFAALHGLYWLTLNLAAEQPLLLAIDDLHWCDRPSLRFLAYLARRLDGAPALVATTLRTGEPGTDPALLARDRATTRPRCRCARARSARRRCAALVRAELGDDADPAFCAACHDATGGNPLLLRQLLRTLEAEGVRARRRATSTPSAPSARAPSPAPSCSASPACPPTPPR